MNGKKADTNRDWNDEDDSPEWTDEMFDRAEFAIGGKVIRPATGTMTRAWTLDEIRARRGRPPQGSGPKVQQSLRLSPEVLEFFRATGPGWQARIDEVLKRHVTMVGQMRREMAEAEAAKSRVAEEQEGFRGEEGSEDPERPRERAAKRAKSRPVGKP